MGIINKQTPFLSNSTGLISYSCFANHIILQMHNFSCTNFYSINGRGDVTLLTKHPLTCPICFTNLITPINKQPRTNARIFLYKWLFTNGCGICDLLNKTSSVISYEVALIITYYSSKQIHDRSWINLYSLNECGICDLVNKPSCHSTVDLIITLQNKFCPVNKCTNVYQLIYMNNGNEAQMIEPTIYHPLLDY